LNVRQVLLSLSAATAFAVAVTAAQAQERLKIYPGTLFDTTFDLGFDVSGVEHTPAAAKAFILAMNPAYQGKVIAACGYFLQYPAQMQSPETRAFCQNLYR